MNAEPWGTSFAERPLLFHNAGGKHFELVPAVEGSGLGKTYKGRGLAVGDLFNDGKLDAVINAMDGSPALLRNVSPNKRLTGSSSNSSAVRRVRAMR